MSAGPCLQLGQESSWASPSLSMYERTSVEWPHQSRPVAPAARGPVCDLSRR